MGSALSWPLLVMDYYEASLLAIISLLILAALASERPR